VSPPARDEQNNSSVISSGGSTLGVTSSTGNSALNSILSGGVSDIREWVNKLYGEAFAAVYVPPAAQVALHLDHEITIDYEPKGRSVRHEKTMPPCLTWISLLCWVLTGCSTDKETLLPHGEQTMLDIWNGAGSQGTQQQLLDARQQLRRPLAQADFPRLSRNRTLAQRRTRSATCSLACPIPIWCCTCIRI
jgi:hypothetical protein